MNTSAAKATMLNTTMSTVVSVKKSLILSRVDDDEEAASVGAEDGWCVGT